MAHSSHLSLSLSPCLAGAVSRSLARSLVSAFPLTAASVRFSDVAVLLALVLLPSALVTLGLIARMFCPQKEHSPQSKAYRSPIEVTEESVWIHYATSLAFHWPTVKICISF